MADANRPGRVRKSPCVILADQGDVEGFGRKVEYDQLYAFQLADGVYKRKEGIISSDGSTSMQENLDLGSNRIVNLADPAEPQEATTKGCVDSRIRLHHAYGTNWGLFGRGGPRTGPIWLDIPPGHKRRKLRMARMPPGKSIYDGSIVLLNLWIGIDPSLGTGLKKTTEFSIFRGLENYYYLLKHAEQSSHPAKGLVFIQDEEEASDNGMLSLYPEFD